MVDAVTTAVPPEQLDVLLQSLHAIYDYFYDQEEIMTFTEESISYTSVCRGSNTSGTVAYPTIMRVIKTKKSYILYISSITAYLVDRKGVCEQVEEAEFDAFLLRVLGKDKIKFKM